MTDTPHDTLFKQTFTHLPWAAEVLRAALPPGLAAHLDWSTLQVVPGSFIDEAAHQHHTDLLYTVRFLGHVAFIHCLYEHQSNDDTWMALRMLTYATNIHAAFRRDNPGARRLPFIFPLVLYNGRAPWTSATSFADLLDLPPDLPDLLRPFIPHFRFALDDLPATTDAAIRTRATSACVDLVLLAFKHARTPATLASLIREWANLFTAVQREASGPRAMQLVFRYFLHVRGADEREVLDVVAIELGKGAQANMQTIADWLEQRGHEKGLQQGVQQGLQQGVQQGQQLYLMRLLRLRFGPLPAAVVTRVEAADEASLARWGELLLTADCLDAVLTAR